MDYIVILADSRCITVALDERRRARISELDDIDLYVEDELSEEFDFSIANMQWMMVDETQFHCVGKIPKFRKI